MKPGRACSSCGAVLPSDTSGTLCTDCQALAATDTASEQLTSTEIMTEPVITGPQMERIGHYKLLQKIGEGGFGVVYMADQEQPVKRRVALKVIKLGMDTRQVVARFEAERQALALMDHPNIAKVFDGGATEAGRPYFVMELVKGVKITQYCDQNHVGLKERLDLFAQVCHAIQHAHQKGIIHRDIKPSNIMVAMHEGKPVPKVIDFGIAKATEQRLTDKTLFTHYEQFMGTPAYMSPEQAEMTGLDIDTRSDIYSLGVLLYELLTGRPPFDNETLLQRGVEEARRAIREVEPPRPSTKLSALGEGELTTIAKQRAAVGPKLLSSVRGDLDWIVMKCLEKDRTRRYETTNGLAMDIQRYLNEEPIVARPPSNIYRFQKLVRRNKAAVAAAAMIVTALLVGLGAATWSLIREQQARLREARERQRAEAAVTRLEIDRAEMLFAAGQSSEALAYLARVLRREPTNRVAAERIISALAHRNFCVPLFRLEHKGTVISAEFSPDGQRVLTACKDGTARIWDGRTGQPLLGPFQHADEVTAAHFSPDGARVVTTSRDKTARIWDGRTGQPVTEPLRHEGGVLCADFSPDGQRLVTGSIVGSMRVWNAATGADMGTPVTLGGAVNFVKFSPDGIRILLASQEAGTCRLVNAADGTELSAFTMPTVAPDAGNNVALPSFSADGTRFLTLVNGLTLRVSWTTFPTNRVTPQLHENTVTCARFSPDGQTLATSGFDSKAKIWDAETFRPVDEMLHENWVNAIEFSADGGQVVTGAKDGSARIWEARTGRPLSEPLQHDASVLSVQFSPDGQRILSRCKGSGVWVWEVRCGQPLTASFEHPAALRKAVFSPDGDRAATTAWGAAGSQRSGNVHLWDARQAIPLLPPLGPGIWDVQFSQDGRRLLALDYDGTTTVWDSSDGKIIGRPIRDTNGWSETQIARFSPDGQLLLMGGFGHRVRVWRIATGSVVREFRHQATAGFAQFSPDGQWVVTTSADKTARLWDLGTGQPLTEPLHHDREVVWADVSADSERVATISRDQTARIWDARSGRLLYTLLHAEEPHHLNSVQFSPDGGLVVTAAGSTAQIWSSHTGQPVSVPLKHDGRVNSVRFGPDGKRLVTASHDGTARIWDVATGHLLSEPIRHRDRVNYAEFSRDGRWVITASYDRTARIWEVPALRSRVPLWLADWAEAVAGQRIDVQNASQSVPFDELLRSRQTVKRAPEGDETARWARWYFAENGMRTISPASVVTVAQWVQQRIEDGTLESLRQAVLLSPSNGLAHARLAFVALTSETAPSPRQIASADWQSDFAVALSPEDSEVLCARAELCEGLGRVSEAWELMERGSRLKPAHPAFWKVKGRMLEQTNRLEEAYQAYSQALSLAGSNWAFLKVRSDVLLRRSDLLRRLNRPAESNADYEKLLETEFTPEECRALSWELVTGPPAARDPERAVLLAEKAVRLGPKAGYMLNNLGTAYYRAGQYRKAVETLLEADRIEPGGPGAYELFFLAMSHQKLGESEAARACFGRALQWWREHPNEGSSDELKSFQAEAEALLSQDKRP